MHFSPKTVDAAESALTPYRVAGRTIGVLGGAII